MKVYIPKYLRKIKIIDQLYNIILSYSEVAQEPGDAFSDYRYRQKTDPVRAFLNSQVPEEVGQDGKVYVKGTDQLYQSVVTYLAELFYEVKGTTKVFDYMTEYLGLGDTGEDWYRYSPQRLEITLNTTKISDIAQFNQLLTEFLRSLLYFGELSINGSIELKVSEELKMYYGANLVSHTRYTITEEDEVGYGS